jgi:glycosyltransferase involved in cell wall biosynthesis
VYGFAFLSSCTDPWGGSEELWWEAASALRGAQNRVQVLKTVVDPTHPRIRHLRRIGCTVRDLDRGLPHRTWAQANAMMPRKYELDRSRRHLAVAAAALMRRRPDLAVVSQGGNSDGAYLARLCLRLRIPYVLVSQKASEMYWPNDEAREYLRTVFGSARRAIFVSEHNRRLTEEQLGMRVPRPVLMSNPVRVHGRRPLPWPAPDGVVRLACVARLHPAEKGQDLLLRVLAGDRWRDRPIHLSCFGSGDWAAGLAGMARHLGVKSVSFEGHAPDIEEVWRAHQALVLPSRAEGMPLALLEAMACGRVPIVVNAGGNAEVVDDGVTGFVAPAATADALETVLDRAWEARARWPEIGKAAARHIAETIPHPASPPLVDLALEEVARA